MKPILPALLIAAATIAAASNAFALSFSADVPLQYTFAERKLNTLRSSKLKEQTSTDTSGVLLTLTHGFLGLGYENYEVTSKARDKSQSGGGILDFEATLHAQVYDVLLDLPLPFVHVALGYGQGRMDTTLKEPTGQVPRIEGADLTQTFLRLGIPIGLLFDIHVGYHVVSVQDAKVAQGGTPDKVKVSGQLLTAGVRLGF